MDGDVDQFVEGSNMLVNEGRAHVVVVEIMKSLEPRETDWFNDSLSSNIQCSLIPHVKLVRGKFGRGRNGELRVDLVS
jgi:hypothetical protein